MKKLIIIFFLIVTANIFSQYSLPLRLVNGTGDPLTGQATNISFTRYPHSYPTDAVSGITVTEVGTAGNYICKGFTTYEYVKLWISGVAQSWFDSVQVGNITSYISSNYILKVGAVTGITGNKTISSGNWLWSGSNTTMYKPYLEGSSPWVTDYSQMVGTSLVPVAYADSVYGIKPYYITGSNIILLSGKKIWGTSLSQPIEINTSHFTWSTSTGLNLSLPYQQDSLYIKKDTISGENTYTKSWSAKRKFFSQTDSMTLYWYYRNSLYSTTDSFQVINNTVSVDVEGTVTLGTSNTKLDSVYLTAGLWSIDFGFNYHFSDASLGGAPTIQPDSIIMCATKSGGSTLFDNVMATQQYVSGVNYGRMGTMTWHANVTVTSPIWIYLNGRRKNTETALNHTTKHHYISALKVR